MSVRLHKIGMGRSPHIGVVGAGVGGLTLAGILSRKLPRAKLTILESHPQKESGDEEYGGYGMSIDEHGQEALVRAGLFDKLWSISRPRSDVVRTFPLRGREPVAIAWPGYVECETNRAGLRSLLLEALSGRAHSGVQYGCRVAEARPAAPDLDNDDNDDNDCGRVELLADGGDLIGTYDLVVDASGLHSPLRAQRVHDPCGSMPSFSGCGVIHGVIDEPEAVAGGAELGERLGEGTCRIIGRGYGMTLQRFGASPSDRRTAFFYWLRFRDEQEAIALAADLNGAGGLDKTRSWLHADMADHFEPVWHRAVDALSQATAQPIYGHGERTVMRPDRGVAASTAGRARTAAAGAAALTARMPLVCLGDSLRCVGLGGGGNLAMQDATALASVLAEPGAFNHGNGMLDAKALARLRREEAEALTRKSQAVTHFERFRSAVTERTQGVDPLMNSLGDVVGGGAVRRLGVNLAGWAWRAIYHAAKWRSGGREVALGSDAHSQLHPSVAAALEEERKISEQWLGVAATIRVMQEAPRLARVIDPRSRASRLSSAEAQPSSGRRSRRLSRPHTLTAGSTTAQPDN